MKLEQLHQGDIIKYTGGDTKTPYVAIVITAVDDSLSLLDIQSGNPNYYTPQGYTYNEYEESLEKKDLTNIEIIGHVPLTEFLQEHIPEYLI